MNPAHVGVEEVPRVVRLHLLPPARLQHLRRTADGGEGTKESALFYEEGIYFFGQPPKKEMSPSLSLASKDTHLVRDGIVYGGSKAHDTAEAGASRVGLSLLLLHAGGLAKKHLFFLYTVGATITVRAALRTRARQHTRTDTNDGLLTSPSWVSTHEQLVGWCIHTQSRAVACGDERAFRNKIDVCSLPFQPSDSFFLTHPKG